MSLGNGWDVIDVRADKVGGVEVRTVYVRIPAEHSTPIDGGCCCDYCKAHPALVPRWDTLAVCAERGDYSWTVHYPDPRPMMPIEKDRRERIRKARDDSR